jgi:hypothetical protein
LAVLPLTKTWTSASVEKSCLPVRADCAAEAEVPSVREALGRDGGLAGGGARGVEAGDAGDAGVAGLRAWKVSGRR